ncbi:hypothetical protein HD806DRAFT_165055 [Xylariaceae sp. AK1471]|nr:hypothetical protein HD806DRAFT_165055 [Xylariaceae sp. AK1471]
MAPLFVQQIAPLQQSALPVPPPPSGPTWADIQQSNRDFIGDRGARSVSEASTLSGIEIPSDLPDLLEWSDEESTVDIVGQLFGADSDSEPSSDLGSDTDEDDWEATVYGKQGARLTHIVRGSTERFRLNTTHKLQERFLNSNLRLAEILYEEAEDFYSKIREEIFDSISLIENRRKYDLRQWLLEFVESHKQRTTNIIEERVSSYLERRPISSSGASVNADDTEKLQLVGIEVDKGQDGAPLDERPAEVASAEPDQFLHQGGGQGDHDNNLETSEEVRAKKHRVWNHLTISQDQTAASDFAKELLSILRSSKFHHTVNESEHRHDESSVDHFISFTPLSHRLIAHKHQGQDPIGVLQQPETESFRVGQLQNLQLHQNFLEQQRLRLRLIRQRGSCQTHTNSEHPLNSSTPSIYPHIEMDLCNNVTHLETQTSSNLPRHSNPVGNAIPDVSSNNENMNHLIDRIASLEAENSGFKKAQEEVARSETLYFIQVDPKRNYATYLDEPMWAIGPRGEAVLKAHFPIHDISGYMSQKRK